MNSLGDLHRIGRPGQILLVLVIVRREVVSQTTGTEFQWLTSITANLTPDSEGQLTIVGYLKRGDC
jgi:hypothetical protein